MPGQDLRKGDVAAGGDVGRETTGRDFKEGRVLAPMVGDLRLALVAVLDSVARNRIIAANVCAGSAERAQSAVEDEQGGEWGESNDVRGE